MHKEMQVPATESKDGAESRLLLEDVAAKRADGARKCGGSGLHPEGTQAAVLARQSSVAPGQAGGQPDVQGKMRTSTAHTLPRRKLTQDGPRANVDPRRSPWKSTVLGSWEQASGACPRPRRAEPELLQAEDSQEATAEGTSDRQTLPM